MKGFHCSDELHIKLSLLEFFSLCLCSAWPLFRVIFLYLSWITIKILCVLSYFNNYFYISKKNPKIVLLLFYFNVHLKWQPTLFTENVLVQILCADIVLNSNVNVFFVLILNWTIMWIFSWISCIRLIGFFCNKHIFFYLNEQIGVLYKCIDLYM